MTTRHMRARMDVMTDGCRCTGASPGSLGRPWCPLRASTRVVSFLGRGPSVVPQASGGCAGALRGSVTPRASRGRWLRSRRRGWHERSEGR
eukprot:scaffold14275_cov107-Isochrysis_galbana.AAC.3